MGFVAYTGDAIWSVGVTADAALAEAYDFLENPAIWGPDCEYCDGVDVGMATDALIAAVRECTGPALYRLTDKTLCTSEEWDAEQEALRAAAERRQPEAAGDR